MDKFARYGKTYRALRDIFTHYRNSCLIYCQHVKERQGG